jgi:hypothetical protein
MTNSDRRDEYKSTAWQPAIRYTGCAVWRAANALQRQKGNIKMMIVAPRRVNAGLSTVNAESPLRAQRKTIEKQYGESPLKGLRGFESPVG